MKIDLQIHSVYSSIAKYYRPERLEIHNQLLDSTLTIQGIFRRAEETGLGAISITDHGLIYSHRYVGEKIKSDVIHVPGAEFRTNLGEILIYGNIAGLRLVGADYFELTEEARGRGCFIAAPHPFLRNPFGFNGLYSPENREKRLDFGKVFSVIDGMCCYWWKDGIDQKSVELADAYELTKIATTDSHAYLQIGCAYTEIADTAKNANEIVEILRLGKDIEIFGNRPPIWSALELIASQTTHRFREYDEIRFLRENNIDPSIVR